MECLAPGFSYLGSILMSGLPFLSVPLCDSAFQINHFLKLSCTLFKKIDVFAVMQDLAASL